MPTNRLRLLRGLGLGLSLSAVNLAGAFLTVLAIGGLGEWSRAQFLGLFGIIELATGIGFIFLPNIWRLPVAEATLKRQEVDFAASAIFIPHWAGAVKSIAGAAFMLVALVYEGVGPATIGLVAVVAAILAGAVGLSMVFARLGAKRPDIDVYFVTIRRPGRKDIEMPGISIGASFVQLLLSIITFPALKALPPSALYQPEMGPSLASLAWSVAIGAGLLGLGLAAWTGKLRWRALPAQQRDAEEAAPDFGAT